MEGIEIKMHVLGWNEKGIIGFMEGGKFLTYVEDPNEELIERIKETYPYISEETRKQVNEYQEGK